MYESAGLDEHFFVDSINVRVQWTRNNYANYPIILRGLFVESLK
jgi:hypothetical protein